MLSGKTHLFGNGLNGLRRQTEQAGQPDPKSVNLPGSNRTREKLTHPDTVTHGIEVSHATMQLMGANPDLQLLEFPEQKVTAPVPRRQMIRHKMNRPTASRSTITKVDNTVQIGRPRSGRGKNQVNLREYGPLGDGFKPRHVADDKVIDPAGTEGRETVSTLDADTQGEHRPERLIPKPTQTQGLLMGVAVDEDRPKASSMSTLGHIDGQGGLAGTALHGAEGDSRYSHHTPRLSQSPA